MQFQTKFPLFIHHEMVIEIIKSFPQTKQNIALIAMFKSRFGESDSSFVEDIIEEMHVNGYVTGKELLKFLGIKNPKQFLTNSIKSRLIPDLYERKTNIEVAKVMDFQEREVERLLSNYTDDLIVKDEDYLKKNVMKSIADNIEFSGYRIRYFTLDNIIFKGSYFTRENGKDFNFYIIIKLEDEKVTTQEMKMMYNVLKEDFNTIIGVVRDVNEGISLLKKEVGYDISEDKIIPTPTKEEKIKSLEELEKDILNDKPKEDKTINRMDKILGNTLNEDVLNEDKKDKLNKRLKELKGYKILNKGEYKKFKSEYKKLNKGSKLQKENYNIPIEQQKENLIKSIVDKIKSIKEAEIFLEKDHEKDISNFVGVVYYKNKPIRFHLLINLYEYELSYEDLNEELKIPKELGYKIGMIKDVDEALDIIFGQEVLHLEFEVEIE